LYLEHGLPVPPVEEDAEGLLDCELALSVETLDLIDTVAGLVQHVVEALLGDDLLGSA
jgi:hypothetical protein